MGKGGKPQDTSRIGQMAGTPNPQDAIEGEGGKYRDIVEGVAIDDRLQGALMPMGGDPSPFVLR